MRSIRLRSYGIGSYTRPQTDAPRAIFVLALIAAAGITLPWAHGYGWSEHGWSERGWSYEQGLVAFGAAIAAVYISAARADGKIGRARFEALGLACAGVGLGATLWFYFAVVGGTDPAAALAQFFFGAAPRTGGEVGLYVSMVGFLSQIAVFVWHVDFRIQLRLRRALRSAWTTAALIGVAAIGVLLPWNNRWPTPDRGWSFNEGVVALAAAAVATILCGLRLWRGIPLLPYTIIEMLCAAAGFGAVAWFHSDVVGHIDPTGYPLLVSWLNAPRSDAGLRESVSAAGFVATFALLAWQLWQSNRSNI